MTQTSSTSVEQDRRNQQQWSHHPEKEARIHHNRTNVNVISAPVKPDEPIPHERNNGGKASNHEWINDQCKTSNKMINYDNQRDLNKDNQRNLNMQFYETSRCYDQFETSTMPVYQRGDNVSNQPLTPPLPVFYLPQHLITIPSFSFYYVVPIFQYWCWIALPNMMTTWIYVLLRHQKYGDVNVQQICVCKYTWNCAVTFINKCFLILFHVMMFNSNVWLSFNPRHTLHQTKRPITATHVSNYQLHEIQIIFCWYKVVENKSERVVWHESFMNENESVEQWTLMQNQQWGMSS